MEPARLPARVARQAVPMRPYGMVSSEPQTTSDILRDSMRMVKKKTPAQQKADNQKSAEAARQRAYLESEIAHTKMKGQAVGESLQKSRQRVGGAVLTGGIEEDDYPEVREAKQKAAVRKRDIEPVSEEVKENAEYRAQYIMQHGMNKDKKRIAKTGRAGV